MGFLSGICSIMLYIYNFILMIAGIIIMCKGLYLLAYASRMKQELGIFTFGVDNAYKDIGMSLVMPASLMMIIAYFGCKAASSKTSSLVIYIALIVLQMSASSYGISEISNNITGKRGPFSVFSYLNKLLVSSELGNLQSLAYPELAIQIGLLLMSLYLLYTKYMEKRRLKNYERNARRLAVLEQLLKNTREAHGLGEESA